MIQLNGPSIARQHDPEMLARIGEAVEKVAKGIGAETYLHLYFENCSRVLPNLQDFKVDGIGVDFRATPLGEIEEVDFKGLACGYVDAGNTRMETPREIATFAETVVETLEPKQLHVTPNYDLEFIPYTFAKQKVRSLGAALRILRGEE